MRYIEQPKVCGSKVEYGVPFFDDLDATEKAIVLHRIIYSLFDPASEPLKDSVYNAAALAALENRMKKTINLEIDMRHWHKKKYKIDGYDVRRHMITAYHSQYPRDDVPSLDSSEASVFEKMIDRLFSEIRPRPYFSHCRCSQDKA